MPRYNRDIMQVIRFMARLDTLSQVYPTAVAKAIEAGLVVRSTDTGMLALSEKGRAFVTHRFSRKTDGNT